MNVLGLYSLFHLKILKVTPWENVHQWISFKKDAVFLFEGISFASNIAGGTAGVKGREFLGAGGYLISLHGSVLERVVNQVSRLCAHRQPNESLFFFSNGVVFWCFS